MEIIEIYFITFGILFLGYMLAIYRNSSGRYLIYFAIALFIVIVGLRDVAVGKDTMNYALIFNNVNNIDFLNANFDSIEYGYKALLKVIHFFTSSSYIANFIIAVITFLLFVNFINHTKNKMVSLFVFFGMFFFPSMNLMRQWLALALIANMYIYSNDKSLSKSLIFFGLAMTIHSSAIVAGYIYLSKIKYNKEILLLVLTLVIFVFVILNYQILSLLAPAFSSRFTQYLSREYFRGSGGISVKTILYLMFTGFFVIVYRVKWNYINENKLNNTFFILILSSVLSLAFSYLGQTYFLIHRIGYYFNIVYIISLPYFIGYIAHYKKIINIALVCSMAFMFLYSLTDDNNGIKDYEMVSITEFLEGTE